MIEMGNDADGHDDALHRALARWITQNGGSVHRNLALHTPALDATADGDERNGDDGGDGGRERRDGDDSDATVVARRRRRRRRRRADLVSQRGIFSKRGPIKKGEVLIRLPRHLALDGSRLPGRYSTATPLDSAEEEETVAKETEGGGAPGDDDRPTAQRWRNASPWLRCLASFVRARDRSRRDDGRGRVDGVAATPLISSSRSEPGFYDPYLASLPEEYDSLLNWSATEIRSFLAGTALGAAALPDARDSGALRERFRRTVSPYLTFLDGGDGFSPGGRDESGEGGDARPVEKERGGAASEGDGCDARDPKRRKVDEATTGRDDDDNPREAEEERLYPLFREGCMCISTRAFHMQSPPTAADTNDGDADANERYAGPYLLPCVDLLNHSPRGSPKHVTTLRRDRDGSFLMVAERDIAKDEEVCHSYDSDAGVDAPDRVGVGGSSETGAATADEGSGGGASNSSQLLQTFGFVDVNEAGKTIVDYHLRRKDAAIDGDGGQRPANLGNVTPAVLTKGEISRACARLAGSSYPDTLRAFMDRSGMSDDGWQHWQIPDPGGWGSGRRESFASLSDDVPISFGVSIPDELITVCCMHFLPDDAMNELLDESTAKDSNCKDHPPSLLLGDEALEDYFLGKLVLRAIVDALKEKMNLYKVSSADLTADCAQQGQARQFLEIVEGSYRSESDRQSSDEPFFWGASKTADANVLSKLMSSYGGEFTGLLQKFVFGMVVSLEERACLLELEKKASDLLSHLDGEDN